MTGVKALTKFLPQCASASSTTAGGFPPSMTTLPFGWVMRNHGTGISYGSEPWFILIALTVVLSVPHCSM